MIPPIFLRIASLLLCLGLTAAVYSSPAHAQDVEVRLMAGRSFAGADFSPGYQSGNTLGLGVSIGLSDNWSLQGTYSYSRFDADGEDFLASWAIPPEEVVSASSSSDLTVSSIELGVARSFLRGPVQPYVSAGFAIQFAQTDGYTVETTNSVYTNDLVASDSWAVQFGSGVRYAAHERFRVFAEVLWRVPFDTPVEERSLQGSDGVFGSSSTRYTMDTLPVRGGLAVRL